MCEDGQSNAFAGLNTLPPGEKNPEPKQVVAPLLVHRIPDTASKTFQSALRKSVGPGEQPHTCLGARSFPWAFAVSHPGFWGRFSMMGPRSLGKFCHDGSLFSGEFLP